MLAIDRDVLFRVVTTLSATYLTLRVVPRHHPCVIARASQAQARYCRQFFEVSAVCFVPAGQVV